MAINSTWSAVLDFDADVYEVEPFHARIAAIRDGIDAELKVTRKFPMFMGPVVSGRSMAESVCENYRALLRRIDELEADISDLLDTDESQDRAEIRAVIDAMPLALGMMPDPWPDTDAQADALVNEVFLVLKYSRASAPSAAAVDPVDTNSHEPTPRDENSSLSSEKGGA